jgi:hypothetical protein
MITSHDTFACQNIEKDKIILHFASFSFYKGSMMLSTNPSHKHLLVSASTGIPPMLAFSVKNAQRSDFKG